MMEFLLQDYTQLQLHSITKDMRFWQLRHQAKDRAGVLALELLMMGLNSVQNNLRYLVMRK